MGNLNLDQKQHVMAFLIWCVAMDDEDDFGAWLYENGGYAGWFYG